jgi:hypothetical protein
MGLFDAPQTTQQGLMGLGQPQQPQYTMPFNQPSTFDISQNAYLNSINKQANTGGNYPTYEDWSKQQMNRPGGGQSTQGMDSSLQLPVSSQNFDDFYKSPEYQQYQTDMQGGMGTFDMYDSPYFGMQTSGSTGRAQDNAYEQYLAKNNKAISSPQSNTLTNPNIASGIVDSQLNATPTANPMQQMGNVPRGDQLQTQQAINQAQGQPVNTQTVQPNFMGQTPFGQPQTSQYSSSNPFIQAAQANAQGNLAGALQATSANRVNQQTPYGSLQYQQTGTDAQGNPIWSANQTVAQPYQNAINSLSGQIQKNFAQPFDTSQYQNQMVGSTPQFQNVGQAPNLQTSVQGTGMQGWDQATNLLMSRLNPQIKQQNEASDAMLANQGIMPGSEAYNRAKTQIAQQQNDLLNQAQLAGSQIQNQMFNQNLAAGTFGNTALGNQNTMNLGNTAFNNALGQQGFANQLSGTAANNAARQANFGQGLTQYQLPTASLGSLRAATTPGYVTPYNQAAVAGPDYLSAYTSQNATDIARSNAEAAQKAATMSGLLGLGSSAILGGTGANSALGGLFNLGQAGLDKIGGSGLWNSLFGGGGSAITGDKDFLKSIGLDNTWYGSGTGGMLTDPLAGMNFSNIDPNYLDNFYNLGG